MLPLLDSFISHESKVLIVVLVMASPVHVMRVHQGIAEMALVQSDTQSNQSAPTHTPDYEG